MSVRVLAIATVVLVCVFATDLSAPDTPPLFQPSLRIELIKEVIEGIKAQAQVQTIHETMVEQSIGTLDEKEIVFRVGYICEMETAKKIDLLRPEEKTELLRRHQSLARLFRDYNVKMGDVWDIPEPQLAQEYLRIVRMVTNHPRSPDAPQ